MKNFIVALIATSTLTFALAPVVSAKDTTATSLKARNTKILQKPGVKTKGNVIGLKKPKS